MLFVTFWNLFRYIFIVAFSIFFFICSFFVLLCCVVFCFVLCCFDFICYDLFFLLMYYLINFFLLIFSILFFILDTKGWIAKNDKNSNKKKRKFKRKKVKEETSEKRRCFRGGKFFVYVPGRACTYTSSCAYTKWIIQWLFPHLFNVVEK